ncbi:low molecular weight protein-tyrosine-phosphatase [Aquincola sp. MAHUQ-54]|uniref:protein-tyrosine-phosphatase n=1 Tax=Aquincola agrisoli TaxID=3119538 RepID=A0AAW9QEE5_9BURK
MVCMGNICRSPTAEAVLRHKLDAAGLGGAVAVASAGTTGYHAGERPDARAIRHALQRGYDLSSLRARQVTAEDFRRFDLILAMDQDNLRALGRMRPPDATAEVLLLMSHATDPQRSNAEGVVPDPYYGPAGGFDHVLDLVEHACDGVVEHVRARLAAVPR